MTVAEQMLRGPFLRLREPFPPEQVGKLPRNNGQVLLDYVGHGAVTERLLEVDPLWNWEPVATNEDGTPKFDEDAKGEYVGLWIRLSVCGVTRLGYGSVPSNTHDAAKQLIGDAIRNAAMRFGVALDLWIKGHVPDDDERNVPDARRASGRARPDAPSEPETVGNDLAAPTYRRALSDGYSAEELDMVAADAVGRPVLLPDVLREEWAIVREAWTAYKAAHPKSHPPAAGSTLPGDSGSAPSEASNGGSVTPQDLPPVDATLGSRARKKDS